MKCAAMTLVAASMVAGCGASQIRTQLSAATVATVALQGVHAVAMSATSEALAACEDEPCVEAVEERMRPVTLAYEASRFALAGWVEALNIAQSAGDEVFSSLLVAARRFVELWSPLAASLRGVGVDLPDLPPLVLSLFGSEAP